MAMSNLSYANLQDLKRQFREWCGQQDRKTLSILITGKSGTGKSSLVNALVGEPVAEVGRNKVHCTDTVTAHKIDIESVEIRVWDSPGLLDDDEGNDERYLAEMKSKLPKQLDLVIFCSKMDETRFRRDDRDTFSILTAHFGKELWKNAVIALTFADKVDDPDVSDKKAYFLQEAANWRKVITKFLSEKLKLNPELIESLPIIPTGYYRRPHTALPNGADWLSEFWMACFNVARDSAGICLYKLNRDRVKSSGSEKKADGSERRPIYLNEEQMERLLKKIWEAFKAWASVTSVAGVIASVGFAIFKIIA